MRTDECKKCGKERTIYGKGLCQACYWYEYNRNKAKSKKNKPLHKKKSKISSRKKIPKAGKSERQKLIRRLDSVFSELRKLESIKPNGKIDCFTCPRELTLQQAQLGHFRRRRHLGARWFDPNGNVQCNRCNVELDGNEEVYEQEIKDHYGESVLKEIYDRSRTTKITNEQLENKLKELTKRLNQIK